MTVPASRPRAVALALGTIAVGLAVHVGDTGLGVDARDVLGDALWAAMIVWWITAIAPRARLAQRAATAYALCALVELSQRIHTPTLDAIRATRLGHLVLGSGFDPRDFAAYAVGVLAAAVLAWRVRALGVG